MLNRIYLLSPANSSGKRAAMLLREQAGFDLAVRLRQTGITLGEAFTFMSGLYFRGKLAYAERFGNAPAPWSGAMVMAPGRGLVPAATIVRPRDLHAMAQVPVDLKETAYCKPLRRDAEALAEAVGDQGEIVLLGSIATGKYVNVLEPVLGERLLFPAEFVGRGDMSRGGLLLRCVDAGENLQYIPVSGAVRHGPTPPKLSRRPPRC